ncbi:WD40 repeat-like protein [Gloeophyllum trabeum ATCC 11539]|uniref:WD40 repeat-like protein n=1 Tax=Gloeophyllum trabeum (strain ATCC 11539 / FP-39264 / Madison 617) TaxID=670483 RepID=S7RXE4_GLOTA|nr:WD40 repeat-like protein [Gloeophyllum trabeum ATCC 11539]EPQ59580.1 WD40 repeat-like protein [Gloeophyllum trabeum ATCC 11539]
MDDETPARYRRLTRRSEPWVTHGVHQADIPSFVSSHKSDTYKCLSILPECDLTPPYACQYSHAAKRGGAPHLAVATEQGTVYIFDTSKRQDWEYEPQRATLQPHHNGVFALSWSPSDTLLATSAGDHVTRISDVATCKTLYTLQKHSGTVKCNAWDPRQEQVLSTGGRDGRICIWDLRISARTKQKIYLPGESGSFLKPVMEIMTAHGGSSLKETGKRKGKSSAQQSGVRSVTNILYPEVDPYGFVSSGSFDGILRHWDMRCLSSKKGYEICGTFDSPSDPTTFTSSRPRGIVSLTAGSGPTAGLIFALGIDSKIHTYTLPSLAPLSCGAGRTKKGWAYEHPSMRTNDFYVGASASPCGRWVACGGTSTDGHAFLFDVSGAARHADARESGPGPDAAGVELRGAQTGSVGALDWAADATLATCADDGTVRVWRPDAEVWRNCVDDPEEGKWDWSWAQR